MSACVWMSGQCFECRVERIECTPGGWIVKTDERRYFRFDADSIALLQSLMAQASLDAKDPAHSNIRALLWNRLLPLGIYRLRDDIAGSPPKRSSSGLLRWQYELLSADLVWRLVSPLRSFFAPWPLGLVLIACLWIHADYVMRTAALVNYRALLDHSPAELVLLVVFCIVRALLHELGHAAACLRLTGSVGPIGCGVFFITPVLYCDVSDVHLLSRQGKAIVGMAGTAVDIAFLAVIVRVVGIEPTVVKIYWISLLALLLNLLPFYRNDGYWVLNDLAGRRELLQQSLSACRARQAHFADWALVGFTACCILLMLALGVTFAVRFGPEQLAEVGLLIPSFRGWLLALITLLQYTALGFGGFALGRALVRFVGGGAKASWP